MDLDGLVAAEYFLSFLVDGACLPLRLLINLPILLYLLLHNVANVFRLLVRRRRGLLRAFARVLIRGDYDGCGRFGDLLLLLLLGGLWRREESGVFFQLEVVLEGVMAAGEATQLTAVDIRILRQAVPVLLVVLLLHQLVHC